MGKLSRRLIAFFVVLSLCSVLQFSAVADPCRGSNDNAPSEALEKNDDSPQIGAEKEAINPTFKKKRSALPWIIGGLAVATGVVLALTVFKKKSKNIDIRDDWSLSLSIDNWGIVIGQVTFEGGLSKGTCSISYNGQALVGGKGTYAIENNKLSILWWQLDGSPITDIILYSNLTDSSTILEGTGEVVSSCVGCPNKIHPCTWKAIRK